MDKKGHLLSNLKRQVLALKNQLEVLQRPRQAKVQKAAYNSKNNRSVTYSSRFDSVSYDCSYLNKGIKKFYEHSPKFKNIAGLINEKSQLDRRPIFSSQRKAENQRTKQNFSSEQPQRSKSRLKSPNPVTGQGYVDKKSGKKRSYEPRKQVEARPVSKKHFNLYY